MPRTKDLRTILLNLLGIQSNKIQLQYKYEKGLAEAAVKADKPVVWSKELREEVKLSVELVRCLFEVAGETSEVKIDDKSDSKNDQQDMSDTEMEQAAALVSKLTKK